MNEQPNKNSRARIAAIFVFGLFAAAALFGYWLKTHRPPPGPAPVPVSQNDCGDLDVVVGTLGPSTAGQTGTLTVVGTSSKIACRWTSAGWQIDDGAVISVPAERPENPIRPGINSPLTIRAK